MATRMYVCESVEHPSSLLMGLNEQRLQGQLCDVTVRVQGHLFKAHTNILASAMGYFRDLFLNPTKQMKKDIIEIPMIVNSIGFAKVLDFIYTSQLCLSQSSVMQVLCSACYLQIPYVVDKCQEFIVTHGHVSPQNTFPTLTDQRYLPKTTENQECELINTPPSPGNQSTSTGNRDDQSMVNGSPIAGQERADMSPNGKPENMVLIKQENNDPIDPYGAGDNPGMTDPNPANGGDVEPIDHDSLAEYFARKGSDNPLIPTNVPMMIGNPQSPTSVEQHLYSMTKNIRLSPGKETNVASPTSSVSQYLLSMKKEKPKKEYRCEYCNKMFGRQQHLKRHILTHTGERPYPCNLCDKRFRRSEHLKHHLVKHQQEANTVGTPFIDYSGPGRKRPRKPMPTDAYGMSKMMLVTYKQQRLDDPSQPDNKKTEDAVGSNPILMNKLNGTTLDTISERLAFAATQREGHEKETDQTAQILQSDTNSPVALNLSGKATETLQAMAQVNEVDEVESSSAVGEATDKFEDSPVQEPHEGMNGLDMSTSSGVPANHEEEHNGIEEELTNSDDSKEAPVSDAQNAPNDMTIDGFESSEVVTNDLKRLFAAMDE